MTLGFCYNTIVDFDAIRFRDFIRDKFAEWRGKGRGSLSDFAAFIGISHQNMSKWYNGNFKRRPEGDSVVLLINKYGIGVYDALGLPRPSEDDVFSKLPPELSASVKSALEEIESLGLNTGKKNASPEELEKIKEIFLKHIGSIKVISN